MNETRQIVVPGEVVGKTGEFLAGQNTYQEGSEIRALRLGVKSVRGDRINVIGLSGRYEPARGDMVIGTVADLGPSNWYINIGAANDVGMHVNDVPWRVEFGETSKYLAIGDCVMLKIVHVDEMKKAQVTMKDRQCRKLTGGLIWEVSPTKVPRIVGRNGSMIQLIKDATSVRIFVGQNGMVWVDGESADVDLALEALNKIEDEAHTSGLTDRMKAWLEERRPSAQRPARPVEEREEAGGEEAGEFRPRERRPRPKVVREDEEAEGEERPFPRGRDRDERPRGRDREERHGGGREERRGGPREERGFRGEREDRRPPRDERAREPRGGADRMEREERRVRRFDDEEERAPVRRERDERPVRRFEEERPRKEIREEPRTGRSREGEAESQFGRGPARRFSDEEERPARRPLRDAREERQERPAPRRFADEDEERPARRPLREEPRSGRSREGEDEPKFVRGPAPRRFDDEDRPARREERPARRFDDEDRPARREERPARRFEEDRPRREPREERPARRASDDEDERPRRPLREAEGQPGRGPRRLRDDDVNDERPVRHEPHHSARRAGRGHGRHKED